MKMNLVGDIGGTNIRLALVEPERVEPFHIKTFKVLEYADPGEAISQYLESVGKPKIARAVIAIATPIKGDHLNVTNNHWAFSVSGLKAHLQLDFLSLVNDFNALAYSLPELSAGDLKLIGPHDIVSGRVKGLIGPGTGLGVSGLLPSGPPVGGNHSDSGWIAVQGEGGHTTFNPRDQRQLALHSRLAKVYGHVSNERLLSGPGLEATFRALAQLDGATTENLDATQISTQAIEGSNPLCVEALELFCECLGNCAADLALTLGSWGGVYIGGGIVPKLGDFFEQSGFRESFENKGRMGVLLEETPTAVIMAEFATLKGAAVLLGQN